MSHLSREILNTLLNLSSPHIQQSLTDRQMEVVLRGFNYLMGADEANLLYIGDEVGLGKTFIALGIASLLRHFSPSPASYQDLILVPKENLQVKWATDIRRFVRHNYLLHDNRVKSVLGGPVAAIEHHSRLEAFTADVPAYHLYRNSIFSFGMGRNKEERLRELQDRLATDEARELLESAWAKDYHLEKHKPAFKRLYGYLLNIGMPPIELLIVDESHNFKHGIGGDGVSDRNQVVSRFMGILQEEEDRVLLDHFPDLAGLVKPLAQKVIFLSATPKTRSLREMQAQAACFLPRHILSEGADEEEVIKERLPHFFIRGNLNYEIGAARQAYSRNRCRHEHRAGGVQRTADGQPLTIQTDEQAALLALLQYKTIRHLDAKHGARFELGMLAGFETFKHDMSSQAAKRAAGSQGITEEADEGGKEGAEYEVTQSRANRQSQDGEIVAGVIRSYREEFQEEPPHPKQDALVGAVGDMMLRGEKSLVFVRRIGSAEELQKRLLNRFEKAVADALEKCQRKGTDSELLEPWLEAYHTRELREKSETMFAVIVTRILADKGLRVGFSGYPDPDASILRGLRYLLHEAKPDLPGREAWLALLKRQLKLRNYRSDLIGASHTLLLQEQKNWEQPDAPESPDADDDGATTPYFFHSNKRTGLPAFKKRLQAADWLEPNYYLIHRKISLGAFDAGQFAKGKVAVRTEQSLPEVQGRFLSHVCARPGKDAGDAGKVTLTEALVKPTLLTTLLLKYCREELERFILERRDDRPGLEKDLKTLVEILQNVLRKGNGLVPLAIAMHDSRREEAFFAMVSDEASVFHLVLREVRVIIRDFSLITTINFPDADERRIQTLLNAQMPAIGITGQSGRSRSIVAAQFRMPGFPYVLVTTDIFREGEDLHTYCQNVYHYGIAWNCSDMEQRTGRIDRINSQAYRRLVKGDVPAFDDKVHIFYPFIAGTLEVNQIACLYHSLNNFIDTFNDFTQPHADHATARTDTAIHELPPVIDEQLTSRYEYNRFLSLVPEGAELSQQALIGANAEDLRAWMQRLCDAVASVYAEWKLPPRMDHDGLSMRAVPILPGSGRKGPVVAELVCTDQPGVFALKVSSLVCAAHSHHHGAISRRETVYGLEASNGFYRYTQQHDLTLSSDTIVRHLQDLILEADLAEQAITNDGDVDPQW